MRPLLFFIAATLTLLAQEPSIDAQIEALQHADASKRYELMNALKQRISSMNAAQRSEAISKLQRQYGSAPSANSAMNQRSDNTMRQQMLQQGNQKRPPTAGGGIAKPPAPLIGGGSQQQNFNTQNRP